MFKYFNKRRIKGQSTLEYAILIIIILGALLSIQVYIKRGIQGRLKSAADDIGDQFSVGNTNVVMKMTTNSISRDTFLGSNEGGSGPLGNNSVLLQNEVTRDIMNSFIVNATSEFWG